MTTQSFVNHLPGLWAFFFFFKQKTHAQGVSFPGWKYRHPRAGKYSEDSKSFLETQKPDR